MLKKLLLEGRTYREISKVIEKSISSICDEIKRNGKVLEVYDPHKAHQQSLQRLLERRKRGKLEKSDILRQYVVEKLEEDWSPEQISGYLKKEAKGKNVLSHETIYQFIYSKKGKDMKLWKHLRHRRKPQRIHWGTRKTRRALIPNRVSIHERPEQINTREEFGHWEGDLMIFSETKAVLAVFVERMTRKTVAVVNENKTSSEMAMALHELLSSAGQLNVKSITFDNGTENVCHQKIREDYMESFSTFFCDPYSSWQKGTVENTNKLLRQYFPRHILPENITQDFLDQILKKLNDRPRKCINFNSPSQSFLSCSV